MILISQRQPTAVLKKRLYITPRCTRLRRRGHICADSCADGDRDDGASVFGYGYGLGGDVGWGEGLLRYAGVGAVYGYGGARWAARWLCGHGGDGVGVSGIDG